ncbi:MAG: hypothetical protein HY865_22215 [Chloroflexi bacterium]|nr:hypothetical protein [Chloroflexota bacterium]
MSSLKYIHPITDRTLADITARTAKGYFNLVDWYRVYDNSVYLRDLLECLLGRTLSWTDVSYPTITTFPTVASLNQMLQNIINMEESAGFPVISGMVVITADWQEGTGAVSPDYEDANNWENLIEQVRNTIALAADYRIQSGVSSCGQQRFFQSRFRTFRYAIPVYSPIASFVAGIGSSDCGSVRGRKFRTYESVSRPVAGLKSCGASRNMLNTRRY